MTNDQIIETKKIFYKAMLQNKNLFLTLSNKEYIVTKIELIDDNIRFKCDEFVTTFGEKFVKIKF